MTLKKQILQYVSAFPGATDHDLEVHLHKLHQSINQACRSLEKEGQLVRRKNPQKGNLIGNYPVDTPTPTEALPKIAPDKDDPLQEEDIKHILADHLEKDGWSVSVAWGHSHGIDIDARKNGQRWILEIKGPGSRQPMRVNYFVSILGEMLQRMDDPNARYSIVFPDMAQYRELWNKLPHLAKCRTGIDMLLVRSDGTIEVST